MLGILENWGSQRFVCVESEDPKFSHCVVLTDLEFWIRWYDELQDWIDEIDGELNGMVAHIPNSKKMTEFCLKWS